MDSLHNPLDLKIVWTLWGAVVDKYVIDDFSNECPFKIASLMTIIFIMNILHCTEETIDL